MTHKEILINKQVRHIVKRIRKIVVSVELCKEIEEDVFFVLSSVGVPMRNQTSDLWILCSDTLPLNHRDFMVSKAHFKVQI